MNQFTQEELHNISNLIKVAPIKGSDAIVVALLQQKIAKLLQPEPPKEEKKK